MTRSLVVVTYLLPFSSWPGNDQIDIFQDEDELRMILGEIHPQTQDA